MAATNKRGIFSLQDVKIRQGSGNWPTDAESFLKPPYNIIDWPFGYYAGGPSHTGVSRLDLSNDGNFASIRGPIAFNSYFGSTSSSSSGGYLGGNESGGRISSVCKIDYANDTATASPKGPYNQIRGNGKGVGNITYGWHCTGQPALTQVDRIDYSNDTTTASPRGNLSFWSSGAASSGNNNYGYIYHGSQQGYNPSVTNTDRIDYSNDTATSSPKGKLTAAVYLRAASGNADYGYCAGGKSPGNNYGTAAMARMDYANDTNNMSPKGPLSVGRAYMGSMGNSDFGYWGGGYNPGPGNMSYQDRLTFANDTATCVARGTMVASVPAGYLGQGLGPLTNAKKPLAFNVSNYNAGITTTGAAFQYESNNVFSYGAGYWCGGNPGPVSTVDRLDYANDTATSTVKGPLSAAKNYANACGNLNFGYVGGGQPPSYLTSVDRIDYSNDSATALRVGNLTTGRRLSGSHGNLSYGYWSGGNFPSGGYISSTERLDFSNDSATAALKANMIAVDGGMGAVNNYNFGYIFGGANHGTRIQRLDYSNDTNTYLSKGNLSVGKLGGSGTGNSDYGWMAAGTSTIERLDFSNDDANPVFRGYLSSTSNSYRRAAGSKFFGYWAGGNTSRVDKLDFSNDTSTTNVGVFSRSFVGGASVSNQQVGYPQPIQANTTINSQTFWSGTATQYGYFTHSIPNPAPSSDRRTDRIDYSNDTTKPVLRSTLTSYNSTGAAASNSNFGYFGGNGSPSQFNRIDYSNETETMQVRGNSVSTFGNRAATGNASYGYWGGGLDSGTQKSTVDRVDYSNDTIAALKGPLSLTRYALGSTGNQSYGYFVGGANPSPSTHFTTVDRVDYSSDTPTLSPKGPLNAGRYYIKGNVGNADYGYMAGGTTPSSVKHSNIQRIDFSNDTATAVNKGNLTRSDGGACGTNNNSYGYWAGGIATPSVRYSMIDRLDFSNDTANCLQRTTMNVNFNYGPTAGNVGTSAAVNGLPQ